MSVASDEKPLSLPLERYVLGTPRIQLDANRISRLASLGLPRRVPCGDHGQGSGPAESFDGIKELPSLREARPARCHDSIGKSSLSSADSVEARKRKADRDAPICRKHTVGEEGHIHPSSRSNPEFITDVRIKNSVNELLCLQDKENINPFSDPRNHELKKQVSDRSQEKRRLQVSNSLQNVSNGRKVGSLLVKQSVKLKTHKLLESSFQSSVISQDVLMDTQQVQQTNTAISNSCSAVESMNLVQADSDMYILGESMSNPQRLQSGCDVSVYSKRLNISPSLQGQDGSKSSSSKALGRHAELQHMRGRSFLPEINQQGVALASIKDLSHSMNSLAIDDTPQADDKRDLLLFNKNVQGSVMSDEMRHQANFAPVAPPAACPTLPAHSVPTATAWSYTIRTGSAPLPTSHTAESAHSFRQQNVQSSLKDSSMQDIQADCAIAAPTGEGNDVKRTGKEDSLVRLTLVENEKSNFNLKTPFQDNLPISNVGADKVIQHSLLPQSKCIGRESNMQLRKQGESEHFVWVNCRRYQKLKKIGRGGSSEVYKVIDRDGNIYALKRIKLKGRDYSTAYGFYQEIELLTKLQGKSYIIRLIDHEVTEKNLFSLPFEASDIVKHDVHIYMVLEYGEVDLATMLQEKFKERGSGVDVDETWLRFYWRQILEAVNTVHEERIIHADLKPANFLLVRGVLKLIDFGIAKSIQGDTTNIQRDAQVGTLNYMSPEAFLMNEKDEYGNVIKCGRPSDIWALGCILYQMVYGKTPFAHLTSLHARIQEVANPNHKINFPPVSNPHLLDIMKKCLAYKRGERLRIPELLNHPFLQPHLAQTDNSSSRR